MTNTSFTPEAMSDPSNGGVTPIGSGRVGQRNLKTSTFLVAKDGDLRILSKIRS